MPQFKVLNPGDPESVHQVMMAAEGTTIPVNGAVALDVTANANGVRVVQPNANELWAFIGIADQAMPEGSLGLVQTKGYRTVPVNQAVGSQAPGLPLVPVAGQYYLACDVLAPANQNNVVGVLMETIAAGTPGTTTLVKVYLFGK